MHQAGVRWGVIKDNGDEMAFMYLIFPPENPSGPVSLELGN